MIRTPDPVRVSSRVTSALWGREWTEAMTAAARPRATSGAGTWPGGGGDGSREHDAGAPNPAGGGASGSSPASSPQPRGPGRRGAGPRPPAVRPDERGARLRAARRRRAGRRQEPPSLGAVGDGVRPWLSRVGRAGNRFRTGHPLRAAQRRPRRLALRPGLEPARVAGRRPRGGAGDRAPRVRSRRRRGPPGGGARPLPIVSRRSPPAVEAGVGGPVGARARRPAVGRPGIGGTGVQPPRPPPSGAGAHRPRLAPGAGAAPVTGAALEATLRQRGRRLELECLEPAAARHLLGPAVPRDEADRLYRASGGNPFYLLELARHGAGGGDPGLAPASVQAAVAGELAPLSALARMLLQGAAVTGDPFDRRLAAAAAGIVETDASTWWTSCCSPGSCVRRRSPASWRFATRSCGRPFRGWLVVAGTSGPTAAWPPSWRSGGRLRSPWHRMWNARRARATSMRWPCSSRRPTRGSPRHRRWPPAGTRPPRASSPSPPVPDPGGPSCGWRRPAPTQGPAGSARARTSSASSWPRSPTGAPWRRRRQPSSGVSSTSSAAIASPRPAWKGP